MTKPQLLKQLTLVFNRYIRLRDTEIEVVATGERGGACISCETEYPFAKLQAGHFVPAHVAATRFDERNVNGQCVRCNKYLHSNPYGYILGLRKKYGAGVAYELASVEGFKPYSTETLVVMIARYKQKVKEIEG